MNKIFPYFSTIIISEKEARIKLIFLPKGEAKGLDDFLTKYGKEEFKKLLDNAKEITLQEIQRIYYTNGFG